MAVAECGIRPNRYRLRRGALPGPALGAVIDMGLGDAASMVNVGAGAGMLLWMSRRGEALLGGLPGGAQHAGDGGPGGAVLSGAGDGRLQLFGGRGELGVGIDQ